MVMEAIVSAFMGELAARSVSFLMGRCVSWAAAPAGDEEKRSRSRRLQRLLLRIHVIVEEAEQRRITSHAMLRQLHMLREEMFRGYHALDHESSRRHRIAGAAGDGDATEVSRSRRYYSAMSQFNPTKRVRLLGNNNDPLEHVLGSLETMVSDVGALVTFLAGCPRLRRQPYSTYIFLDSCMFGRHLEMERVIAFLLQEGHGHGRRRPREEEERPDVLTILGPRRAGKSTLVEHVCRDERVRNHFSRIVSLTRGDLIGDEKGMLLLLQDLVEHHGQHQRGGLETVVLVIVELDGDRNCKGQDAMAVTENLLQRFFSTCSRVPCVTKIIVTSRSDKMSRFGTVEPLRLRPITREAFWYLVKARAFGSTDAADHPKMVSIAMDMAAEMDGSFAAANMFCALLRSRFDARFWSLALAVLRELKKKKLVRLRHGDAGAHQAERVEEELVYLDNYQIKPNGGEAVPVPEVSWQDILFGGARPRGQFDVVAWKSPVPPYYSYAYRCEILI